MTKTITRPTNAIDDRSMTVPSWAWRFPGILDLRGERRTEMSSDDRDRIHSEFHYGMFERRMTLPEGSHVDGITATYDAGILELRIPMDGDRPEARRIAVSTPNG